MAAYLNTVKGTHFQHSSDTCYQVQTGVIKDIVLHIMGGGGIVLLSSVCCVHTFYSGSYGLSVPYCARSPPLFPGDVVL